MKHPVCQPFLAFKQQKLDLIGPSWNVYPRTRYLWISLSSLQSFETFLEIYIIHRLMLEALLTECEGKPKISYVTLFERPGLHEFLSQAIDFPNVYY